MQKVILSPVSVICQVETFHAWYLLKSLTSPLIYKEVRSHISLQERAEWMHYEHVLGRFLFSAYGESQAWCQQSQEIKRK